MSHAPVRRLPEGRCARCAFPRELCLCDRIPRLEVPVQFVILRHASEIPRLTSTARWAALALPGAEIVDYALPGPPLEGGFLAGDGTWALFPSGEPTPPGSARPRRIVVPDGTWQQARRMMQRVPALQRLPAAHPAPRRPRPAHAAPSHRRRDVDAGGDRGGAAPPRPRRRGRAAPRAAHPRGRPRVEAAGDTGGGCLAACLAAIARPRPPPRRAGPGSRRWSEGLAVSASRR